jgi:NAD(P)-dependent dehydrogenase (short-subunit alcohol dehydrogenase family)
LPLQATVAKFSAEFRKQGVLFLSISPGYVDTGNADSATEDQQKALQTMAGKFMEYAPHFTGAITPEESIKAMLSVIENASVDKGDGGGFISHLGNKQWL